METTYAYFTKCSQFKLKKIKIKMLIKYQENLCAGIIIIVVVDNNNFSFFADFCNLSLTYPSSNRL